MILAETFIYLMILVCIGDARKRCDDCKLLRSCPAALEKVENKDEKTQEEFDKAFCGYIYINGVKHRRICCSDFQFSGRFRGIDDQNVDPNRNEKWDLLPQQCGYYVADQIYGGNLAKLREFPWMALISHTRKPQTGRDFSCAGTIISSWYILTAAHCVKNKRVYVVRVGEFDLDKKVDTQGEYPHIDTEDHIQEIEIEDAIPHESYHKATNENDIALLRLKEQVDFNHKNVGPICLPLQKKLRDLTLDDRAATIAGWGRTESGNASNKLLRAVIQIKAFSVCQGYYKDNFDSENPTKICAGASGRDSCNGDSGGPLMLQQEVNEMEKMVQYGIVSFGSYTCDTEFPGVYTDVTKYMDWILNKMKP